MDIRNTLEYREIDKLSVDEIKERITLYEFAAKDMENYSYTYMVDNLRSHVKLLKIVLDNKPDISGKRELARAYRLVAEDYQDKYPWTNTAKNLMKMADSLERGMEAKDER